MLSAVLALLIASPVSTGVEMWRGDELRVRDAIKDFAQIQSIAFRYIGRPYVRAGSGAPGFDCSGFSCRVFAESGYAIPRTSREQSRVGKAVRREALMPGDLLFFAGSGGRRVDHVGIYLGGGKMIHAASGEGRVIVSNVDDVWYRKRYVGARRVLGVLAPSLAPSSATLPQSFSVSDRLGFGSSVGLALSLEAGSLQAGTFELELAAETVEATPFGFLRARTPACFLARGTGRAETAARLSPGSFALAAFDSVDSPF